MGLWFTFSYWKIGLHNNDALWEGGHCKYYGHMMYRYWVIMVKFTPLLIIRYKWGKNLLCISQSQYLFLSLSLWKHLLPSSELFFFSNVSLTHSYLFANLSLISSKVYMAIFG